MQHSVSNRFYRFSQAHLLVKLSLEQIQDDLESGAVPQYLRGTVEAYVRKVQGELDRRAAKKLRSCGGCDRIGLRDGVGGWSHSEGFWCHDCWAKWQQRWETQESQAVETAAGGGRKASSLPVVSGAFY